MSYEYLLTMSCEYLLADARNPRSPSADRESMGEDERRNIPTGKLKKKITHITANFLNNFKNRATVFNLAYSVSAETSTFFSASYKETDYMVCVVCTFFLEKITICKGGGSVWEIYFHTHPSGCLLMFFYIHKNCYKPGLYTLLYKCWPIFKPLPYSNKKSISKLTPSSQFFFHFG